MSVVRTPSTLRQNIAGYRKGVKWMARRGRRHGRKHGRK